MRALSGDAVIRSLPSFRSVHWEIKPGDYCAVTKDCFTRPGCVQLVSESAETCERDLEVSFLALLFPPDYCTSRSCVLTF